VDIQPNGGESKPRRSGTWDPYRPSRTKNARCHSTRELVRLKERRPEELVDELRGPRYSRGHIYRRGGSYTKRLITSLGMIRFRVKRVVRRTDGKVYSPILEGLDVKQRKYSRDVRMKCVEFASKISYGDAGIEFETATSSPSRRRCRRG